MHDRSTELLRLLIEHDGYTTIDRLAEATGAGVRTIHRDLGRLERSLALRGVRLERRRGMGVRLLDPLPESLESAVTRAAGEPRSDAEHRPFSILLYLLATARWTKLSELANVFLISDSSVGTALSDLCLHFCDAITIRRQKGVGVQVAGDEQMLRLLFVTLFPQIIPRSLLLDSGEAASSGSAGTGRSDAARLLEGIGFYHGAYRLMRSINDAELACGYQFTPLSRSFLYSYLFIVRRRVPEQGPLRRAGNEAFEIPSLYRGAAVSCGGAVLGDAIGNEVPKSELDWLSRILAAAEPTDVSPATVTAITDGLSHEVDAVLEHSLCDLESSRQIWLHGDQNLLNYLRVIFATTARRIALGMPRTPGLPEIAPAFAGRSLECSDDEPCSALVRSFANQFRESLRRYLPQEEPELCRFIASELSPAVFALRAQFELRRHRRAGSLSVKILCYEGMGMSAYLSSLTRDVLPAGSRIDSRWENPFLADVTSRYDLVISTFPIQTTGTPVLVIEGDASPETIRNAIRSQIESLVENGCASSNSHREREVSVQTQQPIETSNEITVGSEESEVDSISPATTMSVIHGFFACSVTNGDDIVQRAVAELDRSGDCNQLQLRLDFERREGYGSVVFEEIKIRLLHCRSDGIPEPRAGVIRVLPDRAGASGLLHEPKQAAPTVLVLAAPFACPPDHTRVLSELVVALTERPSFATLLSNGDRSELQAELLSLFSRRFI